MDMASMLKGMGGGGGMGGMGGMDMSSMMGGMGGMEGPDSDDDDEGIYVYVHACFMRVLYICNVYPPDATCASLNVLEDPE
jgi:hypothetical protein